MTAETLVNVPEALEYVDNLDVSSKDGLSDYEDFISREDFLFYLQKTKVIDTLMKIQEMKKNFSQTI